VALLFAEDFLRIMKKKSGEKALAVVAARPGHHIHPCAENPLDDLSDDSEDGF